MTGPSSSSCPVSCMACKAPSVPARAKPERLLQDSTDSSVPARAGMPRSGFRKPAHGGCCQTRRSQTSPPHGGNCEGPPTRRRRTFTASGTTVGGMNPGQATEPGSFSKTAGPTSPHKPARGWPGRSTRQGPQPGQDPRLGKVRRPGRSSWRKATQPGATLASPASQPTRGVHGNPATGQLPSHPGRTMGRDLNH